VPLPFKLYRRHIAQGCVDAFMLIHVVQEPAELLIGVGIAFILGQRHVLLFDRTDQPLSIAVLCGLTPRRHADLAANEPQEAHIAVVGVPDTLIRVMELGCVPLEGSWQGCEGQAPIQVCVRDADHESHE
jgi:hypothetical protein